MLTSATPLLLLASSALAADIPTSGRYFFADFYAGDEYGRHYLDIEVGSQKTNLPLWISTTEAFTGVVTTECGDDMCDCPYKWNREASNSYSLEMSDFSTPFTDVFDGRQLALESFSGAVVKDTMRIKFDSTHTQEIQTNFLAIERSSTSYKSYYSGFVGLAPYTGDSSWKNFNFLYQLKKNHYIDHLSFSIYTRN